MNTAQILSERKEIFRGRYVTFYKWEGNVHEKVYLPNYFDVSVLPFPLRKIDFDLATGFNVYIRRDVNFWWIIEIIHHVRNLLLLINSRIILTLAVWGVVKIPVGEIPSWKVLFRK